MGTYNNGQPSGGASTGMSWLDGINRWGEHPTKTGPCTVTTTDLGNHGAIFSQLKFGDIGTTVPNFPPAPAPVPPPAPPPAPPPGPSCDCSWVDQYGCHGSDGSVCYDVCCGSEVLV